MGVDVGSACAKTDRVAVSKIRVTFIFINCVFCRTYRIKIVKCKVTKKKREKGVFRVFEN